MGWGEIMREKLENNKKNNKSKDKLELFILPENKNNNKYD